MSPPPPLPGCLLFHWVTPPPAWKVVTTTLTVKFVGRYNLCVDFCSPPSGFVLRLFSLMTVQCHKKTLFRWVCMCCLYIVCEDVLGGSDDSDSSQMLKLCHQGTNQQTIRFERISSISECCSQQ